MFDPRPLPPAQRLLAMPRRDALRAVGAGFGSLALSSLLAERGNAGPATTAPSPLAPRAGHFPTRARRVIFLFMHGGPSHVDTFDYKPLLARDHGKPMPSPKPRVQFAQTGNLYRSPWEFRQYGECGRWISDLFPRVAGHADRLCVINSLHTNNVVHGDAVIHLHTGSDVFVRPSMGAWITYGLGSENENLPGFMTLSPSYAHGGVSNWSAAFLPAEHQGTPIGNDKTPIRESTIRHIKNAAYSASLQRAQLDLLRERERTRAGAGRAEANGAERSSTAADAAAEARIAAFELAFRMQVEAPAVMDLSGETAETRALYGLDEPATADFGMQCLLARRFCERGVRFVQCSHSYKWDQHGNLKADHAKNAREVDQPIAALLADLSRRGLLEETLVLWGGEFGRTPTAQGDDGRDHNPYGYSMWLAGGGVRGGMSYGATDDYGYYAVQDRVAIHDLHATILRLLGLDHERLTFRRLGRDFRLTDVAGRVIEEILA